MSIHGNVTEKEDACLYTKHGYNKCTTSAQSNNTALFITNESHNIITKSISSDSMAQNSENKKTNSFIQIDRLSETRNEGIEAEVLSLFPFICGFCFEKFNKIDKYYTHFSLHEEYTKEYFHSCTTRSAIGQDNERGETKSSQVDVYSCGMCSFVSPSLCLLHEHLVLVENIQRYEIDVQDKMAYPKSDKSDKPDSFHVKVERKKRRRRDAKRMNKYTNCKNSSFNHQESRKTKKNKHGNDNSEINDNKTEVDMNVEKHRQYSDVPVTELENWLHEKVNDHEEDQNELESKHETDEQQNEKRELVNNAEEETEESDDMISEIKFFPNQSVKKIMKKQILKMRKNKVKQKLKWSGSFTEIHKKTSTEIEADRKGPKSKLMKDEEGNPIYANNTLIPCEKCGTKVQRGKISVHMISHRETRDFPCNQCPYRSKSSFALKQHLRMVHTTGNNFICQTCGKSFKNSLYLKQHTNTHSERDKQCDKCPQTFTTIALLRRHMLVHKDEKQYSCAQCERQFTFKGNLNTHVRTVHSDQRNFECNTCGKMFKIIHALKKHTKTHLPHEHFCFVCGKSFVTAFNMRVHMKVHTK